MTAVPALFANLPGGIFGPLASPNREHYWLLLCRLFDEFFGPDAPLPPSDGIPRRDITAAVERYLLTDDPWESEDGEVSDAPLNVRANAIHDRFRGAGWLRQERIGAREMVSMPPLVSRLLATLIEFGEHGPTFVSAKMRSVELQLQQILEGKAAGDALDEAADQARRLLVSLSSMSLQVRDLMPELSKAETTAQFARQWFERYVGQLFIGDYAELHTSDHPLARRSAILAMARQLQEPAQRARLLDWYREHLTAGDEQRAALRLQRGLQRLHELERIDEYLGRLDDDIRQANRRALAFLDYRLRAPDRLDVLLQRAVRGVLVAAPEQQRMPVAAGALMDESRLRPPRRKPQPIPRSANSNAPPTPEQLARLSLLRQIKRARLVNAEDMARYVGRHLGQATQIDSRQLSIDSIPDLRAYQTLLTLALRSRRVGGLRREDPLSRLLRGFRVELIDAGTDDSSDNDFLHGPDFRIHRLGTAPNRKSA
ncbi:Wadjet anti-phage system protein JetA family protein [Pseudoxanthomonas dokdonensis]|nr:Wadjet anti-phage system protein JetA family protein [Pseudoxanthomonas dokdonensis]